MNSSTPCPRSWTSFASLLLSIAAILLVLCNAPAVATIKVINIKKAFMSSDAVLFVRVSDGVEQERNGELCGERYVGKVLAKFKGSGIQAELKFGRWKTLRVGGRYILFLKKRTSIKAEYRRIRDEFHLPEVSGAERRDVLKRIACGGLVPGYEFDPEMAWEVYGESVLIEGIRPDELRDQRLGHDEVEPLLWSVPTDELFSYFKALRRDKH